MPTGNIFAQFLGATWAALRGKCKGLVSSIYFLTNKIDRPIIFIA